MDSILSDNIHVARKEYRCDSCDRFRSAGYTVDDCETEAQRKSIIWAKDNGWKILPGQPYRKIVGVYDGQIMTYRTRIDVYQTCLELFDNFND